MIFDQPANADGVDQGDIIDGCPLFHVESFDPDNLDVVDATTSFARIIVLTQACDLANRKVSRVTVAPILVAQELVDKKLLKPVDIQGPLQAGRIFGWYFLLLSRFVNHSTISSCILPPGSM